MEAGYRKTYISEEDVTKLRKAAQILREGMGQIRDFSFYKQETKKFLWFWDRETVVQKTEDEINEDLKKLYGADFDLKYEMIEIFECLGRWYKGPSNTARNLKTLLSLCSGAGDNTVYLPPSLYKTYTYFMKQL